MTDQNIIADLAATRSRESYWDRLAGKWPRGRAIKVRDLIDKAGLCGCGTSAHWEIVLELLEQSKGQSDRKTIDSDDKGFYVDQWHEFGAKVLDSWGWLEHGTGIGWAWLTESGMLILEFLRDFGICEHSYNDSTGHPGWSIEFSWDENVDSADAYSEWLNELAAATAGSSQGASADAPPQGPQKESAL